MILVLSQKALQQLLHTDRFFKNDFAVVLQPFLKHADPPRLPVSSDHLLFINYYNLLHFAVSFALRLRKM